MTLRIEKSFLGEKAIVRLIGRLAGEDLEEVAQQLKSVGALVMLDLSELSLLSQEGVRFFNECQDAGITVTNASPFISTWMARERQTGERA